MEKETAITQTFVIKNTTLNYMFLLNSPLTDHSCYSY